MIAVEVVTVTVMALAIVILCLLCLTKCCCSDVKISSSVSPVIDTPSMQEASNDVNNNPRWYDDIHDDTNDDSDQHEALEMEPM